MKNTGLVALTVAAAIVAGCGKDDGSSDIEKAEAALAAGDVKTAEFHFAAASGKCVTNFPIRVQLAELRMELGNVEGAQTAVDEALALMPDSAEARIAEGKVKYLRGDFPAAEKILTMVANEKTLSKELRAVALESRALAEIAENSFVRARLTLWRAMRLDRKNAAVWYHLGKLSRDVWRFEDSALEQYGMASRLENEHARVEYISRDVMPALREAARAKLAQKPGVSKRNPGASAKLVSEAEAALAKKDLKKARTLFKNAYESDVLSFAAAWNYAKLLSAAAKSDADVEKVLEIFSNAIDQKPNSQENYRIVAKFALNHGKAMRAEKLLSRALSHDPEDKRTLTMYVYALNRTGRVGDAKLYDAYLKEL